MFRDREEYMAAAQSPKLESEDVSAKSSSRKDVEIVAIGRIIRKIAGKCLAVQRSPLYEVHRVK